MSVYSEFQSLEKVALGSIFPTEELLSNIRLQNKYADAFRLINDTAADELSRIEVILRSLNVEVLRPTLYPMNQTIGMTAPPLAVRDTFLIYGNDVIESNEAFENHQKRIEGCRPLYSHLKVNEIPHCDKWSRDELNQFNSEELDRPYLHTANVLRCGRDLFVSNKVSITGNQLGLNYLQDLISKRYPGTRLHWVNAEDHLDGYIFLVRPGLMLSTLDKDDLPEFFKKWEIISVTEEDRSRAYTKTLAYKWKKLHPLVASEYSVFLSNCTEETFFTLNALSINENTVMFPGRNARIFNRLEKLGVTCISVDMKAISFWDSGLHCCTNEISRIGDLEDYS